jgi:hypothetical protein
LSLCVTNLALCHEGVWGSGCIDPSFLGLGTSWRRVVSFTPLPLYPRGKSPPGTHRIGGWVGPRAGLDDVEKGKFLTLGGLELRPLSRPVCSQSLYAISDHCSFNNNFNNTLSSTLRSSKRSFPFGFPDQNFVSNWHLSQTWYIPVSSLRPCLMIITIFGEDKTYDPLHYEFSSCLLSLSLS